MKADITIYADETKALVRDYVATRIGGGMRIEGVRSSGYSGTTLIITATDEPEAKEEADGH